MPVVPCDYEVCLGCGIGVFGKARLGIFFEYPLVDEVAELSICQPCGISLLGADGDAAVIFNEVLALDKAAGVGEVACGRPADHYVDVAVLHDLRAGGADIARVAADDDIHALGSVALRGEICVQLRLEGVHIGLIESRSGLLVVPCYYEVAFGYGRICGVQRYA